ncbi:hypothetical protein R3W88_027040 [Solanum pinnatisectum]|uniref:C2H2-type domain-containing protein n=1 Tax=Solanum pinnatisectum TaxID=50273 RepID=A0AAV9LF63_9SOLN|nr:hypothetical protein R3W88_027040 [Solanum pinnatisectum]
MEREEAVCGGDRLASSLKNQAEGFEEVISEVLFRYRKKHKRKVAALREHNNKNCSIGLLPKKPKLMQLMEPTNDNDPPSSLTDDSPNDLGKNAADEKQDNREFTFWCDTCQIGTFSEIVMESHKIGKKHKRETKTAALDKQC